MTGTGRVALITGSTGGIGRAVSEPLPMTPAGKVKKFELMAAKGGRR
jgi:NADP-dependent 3-hydroxy acid dehydrogenase YdfG